MLSWDEFRQSRLYKDIRQEVLEEFREEVRKEVREESKLEMAKTLASKEFTVEEIAEIVKLDVEKVRQAIEEFQGE